VFQVPRNCLAVEASGCPAGPGPSGLSLLRPAAAGVESTDSTAPQPMVAVFWSGWAHLPLSRFLPHDEVFLGSHSIQHTPVPVQEHQYSCIREHCPFRIRPFWGTSSWAQTNNLTNNLTMHFQVPHCNLPAVWAASLCIRLQPYGYLGQSRDGASQRIPHRFIKKVEAI
jgi:hypothetical protein